MPKTQEDLKLMGQEAIEIVNENINAFFEPLHAHADKWGEDDGDKGAVLFANVGLAVRRLLKMLDRHVPPHNEAHRHDRVHKICEAALMQGAELSEQAKKHLAKFPKATVQ